MKKIFILIVAIFAVACFGKNSAASGQQKINNAPPSQDSAGFSQANSSIQSTFNSMYSSLPPDLQNRIQSAALSMENIRSKSPADAQTYLATQRQQADLSITEAVSQMSVTDAVKTQIDNSQREIYARMNEKILDLKARRTARP